MYRRSGATLMEILIAIFIMGIGLLAVMSLFPLGALTMARAIKDDRAGHAVANAKAIATAKNIRFDPEVMALFDALQLQGGAPLYDQSYPIYVDPIGYVNNSPSNGDRTKIPGTSIARSSLSFIGINEVLARRWCTSLDDIAFSPEDGKPSLETGAVQRGSATSWAWMLRRPKAGVAQCCDMSVVVYNQRPLAMGGLLSAKENAYAAFVDALNPEPDPGLKRRTMVTLKWGGTGVPAPPPTLVVGEWVLDASERISMTIPPKPLPPHATFHRVVKVGDIFGNAAAGFVMEIELATPLLGRAEEMGQPRLLVVMDGVVEVFNCGPGWSSGPN